MVNSGDSLRQQAMPGGRGSAPPLLPQKREKGLVFLEELEAAEAPVLPLKSQLEQGDLYLVPSLAESPSSPLPPPETGVRGHGGTEMALKLGCALPTP